MLQPDRFLASGVGTSMTTATGTSLTSSDKPYPKSRMRNTGKTRAIADAAGIADDLDKFLKDKRSYTVQAHRWGIGSGFTRRFFSLHSSLFLDLR